MNAVRPEFGVVLFGRSEAAQGVAPRWIGFFLRQGSVGIAASWEDGP